MKFLSSTLIYLPIITFLFIGCASTYSINNFSSKENYYENFNKSINNKTFKITLINDSSFTTSESVKIVNDNLVVASPDKSSVNSVPIKRIKEIRTYNEGNPKFAGTLIGTAISFMLSLAIIAASEGGGNHSHTGGFNQSFFPASLVYAAVGGLVGYGIGSLSDKTIIYQFNQ